MIDYELFNGWLYLYTGDRWSGPRELSWSVRVGIGSLELIFHWVKDDD